MTSVDNARLLVAEMNCIGQANNYLKSQRFAKFPGGIYRNNTPEQWAALQRFGGLLADDLAGLKKITVLCLSETGSYCAFCLDPDASKQCSLCREANYCNAGGVASYGSIV
jgi:hypothetical protein